MYHPVRWILTKPDHERILETQCENGHYTRASRNIKPLKTKLFANIIHPVFLLPRKGLYLPFIFGSVASKID